MISAKDFTYVFIKNNITMFAGVPDSVLKELTSYLGNNETVHYLITANEGNAVGYGVGHYLSSGNIPVVFLQNSGLGNAMNPIVSLADNRVYDVPMIFIVGWRGRLGENDACQHIRQGEITIELLKLMGIEPIVIESSMSNVEIEQLVQEAIDCATGQRKKMALVISNGTFSKTESKVESGNEYSLTCREALNVIQGEISDSVIVTTTGRISREWFHVSDLENKEHNNEILNIGAMGHASQIALGIAHNLKKKDVYCIDGDGAFLMHMGSAAYVAKSELSNFKHVVLNNGLHATVGEQKTAGFCVDFAGIAAACGYKKCYLVKSKQDLHQVLHSITQDEGPIFVEVRISEEYDKDTPRPYLSAKELGNKFMNHNIGEANRKIGVE